MARTQKMGLLNNTIRFNLRISKKLLNYLCIVQVQVEEKWFNLDNVVQSLLLFNHFVFSTWESRKTLKLNNEFKLKNFYNQWTSSFHFQ